MSLAMVPLGRTGTTVSELAFGTWRFGRQNDDGEVEVGRDRAHELLDAYAAAGAVLQAYAPHFAEVLDAIDGLAADLNRVAQDAEPPAPRWGQSWFPGLDAAAAYALVRRRAPARIVEVGSGHSTRWLARAVQDGGLATTIRCIDPAPRARLDGLPVTFERRTLQQAGAGAAADLEAGDLLFVDSSHVQVPGSDVELVLAEILPRLPRGALLHVHDVFLPDDYPGHWAWRSYNEQGAVAALLGAGWRPLFASHYVATRMADRVAAGARGCPAKPAEAVESSLWLEKTIDAAL